LENEKQAKENLTGSAAFNGGPREKRGRCANASSFRARAKSRAPVIYRGAQPVDEKDNDPPDMV